MSKIYITEINLMKMQQQAEFFQHNKSLIGFFFALFKVVVKTIVNRNVHR